MGMWTATSWSFRSSAGEIGHLDGIWAPIGAGNVGFVVVTANWWRNRLDLPGPVDV
jgi:hypothetical protein